MANDLDQFLAKTDLAIQYIADDAKEVSSFRVTRLLGVRRVWTLDLNV